MTYDIWFGVILLIIVLIGCGMFIGYAMDDEDKDPITACIDGYIIVVPMICMIAFLAPLLGAVYSVICIIYSIGKIIVDNVTINSLLENEVVGPGLYYSVFVLVFIFWNWFRTSILGYREIL